MSPERVHELCAEADRIAGVRSIEGGNAAAVSALIKLVYQEALQDETSRGASYEAFCDGRRSAFNEAAKHFDGSDVMVYRSEVAAAIRAMIADRGH